MTGARRRPVLISLVAWLFAALGVLTGCTTAHLSLGTSASSCFDALAVASEAVHDNGSFAGVRLLTVATVGTELHLEAELAARVGPSVGDVCVVSYRGTFAANRVARPLGHAPPGGFGRYAIVLVSKPQNRLVGTVIRQTQPLRFGHPF
ncbi:MAG TPA: hypothetical protein VNC61_01635 [Acidimicrobiales bacterium]|nr:hypothetical protein [Acidimicrobiales bacterium]